MNQANWTKIALLALLACSACQRNERQRAKESEEGRTATSPPAGMENQKPAAPNATSTTTTGREVVGAREQVPLGKGEREASADFKAAKGQKLSGDADFRETPTGVLVTVAVSDAPAGMKAVEIHEKGDCSNIEGHSMGKHFAPKGEKHGLPTAAEHHPGDLGNITVDDKGKGRLEITVAGANLKDKDPMSLLDKSIVVYSSKDTGAQAEAAMGKPLACAVIKKD